MNYHQKVINHYGEIHQIKKAIEEMSELSAELKKVLDNPELLKDQHHRNVTRSELCDAELMLFQMSIVFNKERMDGGYSVGEWMRFKAERTSGIIDREIEIINEFMEK